MTMGEAISAATGYPRAGRELDRIVGARLLGYTVEALHGGTRWALFRHGEQVTGRCHSERGALDYLPRYSTQISAAWAVAEEAKQRWGGVWVSDRLGQSPVARVGSHAYRSPVATGDTVPEALCRAALLALDAEAALEPHNPVATAGLAGAGPCGAVS